MEIKISGSSKEIADLASELQNRLISNQVKIEQQSCPLSLSVGRCALKDIEDMQNKL